MSDQIFYTEGAKNSFFLSFSKSIDFKALRSKALALGLDPDGYILAPRKSQNEADFVFYNKDSSVVDFCGNALRAVGLCFYEQFNEKNLRLNTVVGQMKIEVVSVPDDMMYDKSHDKAQIKSEGVAQVKAQMPVPQNKGELGLGEGLNKAQYILAGVPHLVFNLLDMGMSFSNLPEIKDFCLNVRSLKFEDQRQTFNLSFYELTNSLVEAVTFERGVEDFTKACGSGALSVYATINKDYDECRYSEFKMPGGCLSVQQEDEMYFMLGPARIIKRIVL